MVFLIDSAKLYFLYNKKSLEVTPAVSQAGSHRFKSKQFWIKANFWLLVLKLLAPQSPQTSSNHDLLVKIRSKMIKPHSTAIIELKLEVEPDKDIGLQVNK